MVDYLIRIYPSGYSTFNTVGLGTLAEATEAIVSEERNGEFELQVVYPMTGIHFYDLELGRILTCKTNPYDDVFQPFRIYSISKPMNGQVIINARHISYDLLGHVALPFAIYYNKEEDKIFINDEPTELDEILDAALKHLTKLDRIAVRADEESEVEKRPFTFEFKLRSGDSFPSVERFASQEPSPLRSILGESNESLIATFGGELEFNGYKVILWSSRGTDSGVKIRYGKNMTDIQADGTSATCYTGVFPYYKSTSMVGTTVKIIDDGSGPVVPIPRDEFFDPDFFDTNVNTLPLSLSSSDFSGGKPTAEALRSYAELYIAANKLGQPAFNITVSYQPISDSPEYAAYKSLEAIRLCDKVTVEHATLGIQNSAEVVRVEYNILKNRYDTIELAVNSDVKSITKTISNLRRDTSGAADTAKDAVDAISSAKTEVDEIKGDVEAIGADVDNLNTDVENVKSDVDNVKTDVDDVKTDVENVKTDVTTANTNASEALGVAYNASGRVDEMDMRVGQLEIDVDNASHAAERAESKADTAVVRQRTLYSNSSSSSPKTVNVSGYEELSYIKSDGASALELGLEAGSNLSVEVVLNSKWESITEDGSDALFGYSKIGYFYTLQYDSFHYANKRNNTYSVHGKKYKVTKGKLYVDGKEVVSLSDYTFGTKGDSAPVYFGGDYNNGTTPKRFTVAEFNRINADLGSGNKREFVPMLRVSDKAIGFYELTTKSFHKAPNGWTAGKHVGVPPIPDNPQTSWEIPDDFKKYWSETPPSPEANTLYYTCVETQLNNGLVYYSEPMEDKNGTVLLSWCKNADMTVIDGGMIAANTIAADKIIANDLMANGIETGILASREFIESGGTQGMAIDLTTGQIISNNGAFMVNVLGQMFSTAGKIGSFEIMPDGSLRAVYRKEQGGGGYETNQVFELTTYTTGEIRPETMYRLWIGTDRSDDYIADQFVHGIEITQSGVAVYNEEVIQSGAGTVRLMHMAVYSSSNVLFYSSTFDRSKYPSGVDAVVSWRKDCLNPEAVGIWKKTMDLTGTIENFDDRISALES